ncbi:MAG: GNAT family N-acetyltransferase [Nocardioidaceae bacterium]
MTEVVFRRRDVRLGELAVRHLDPRADSALLHRWVTHPKAVFWQLQDAAVSDVERQYATIAATTSHDAYLGLHEGRPAFLVERYDPTHDEIGGFYPVQPGDVGMHFLVAPTRTPVHGFTRAVIGTVMEMLFADPGAYRIVVEPDVRNRPVHALNAAVGFRVQGTISLRDKDAYLSTCTRDQYLAATAAGDCSKGVSPVDHPSARPTNSRRTPDAPALGPREPLAGPQGARRVLPRTPPHPGAEGPG